MTVLVVDVANVVGARPDGWWRDRAGAASRLLDRLARLPGTPLPATEEQGTGGERPVCARVVAVVEGAARDVAAPPGVELVRAPGSGDDALVARVSELAAAGDPVLVVTADRGLRARLPAGTRVAGPGRLLTVLDEVDGTP